MSSPCRRSRLYSVLHILERHGTVEQRNSSTGRRRLLTVKWLWLVDGQRSSLELTFHITASIYSYRHKSRAQERKNHLFDGSLYEQ